MHQDSAQSGIIQKWNLMSWTYDTFYGHSIKSNEEMNAWVGLFNNLIPKINLNVLDIGCGSGEMSLLLAQLGHSVTGIDLSENMLCVADEKARKKGLNIKFLKGDAEDPPFESNEFDVIVARHLFWTLLRPEKAVNRWKRILKNGGIIILIDGVYYDPSLKGKILLLISDILIYLKDKKRPQRGYAREINSLLPNLGGMPAEKAENYLNIEKFRNIKVIDLKNIVNIEKRDMPLRKKIAFRKDYYAICGIK